MLQPDRLTHSLRLPCLIVTMLGATSAFGQAAEPECAAGRFRLTLGLTSEDGDPTSATYRGEPVQMEIALHNDAAEHELHEYEEQLQELWKEMAIGRTDRTLPPFVETTVRIPHGTERWLDACELSIVRMPSEAEATGGGVPVTWFTNAALQSASMDRSALFVTAPRGMLGTSSVYATLRLPASMTAQMPPGTYEFRATYDTTEAALASQVAAGRAEATPLRLEIEAVDTPGAVAWVSLRIANDRMHAGDLQGAMDSVNQSLASDETCAGGEGHLLRSLLLRQAGRKAEALPELQAFKRVTEAQGRSAPAWLDASISRLETELQAEASTTAAANDAK